MKHLQQFQGLRTLKFKLGSLDYSNYSGYPYLNFFHLNLATVKSVVIPLASNGIYRISPHVRMCNVRCLV